MKFPPSKSSWYIVAFSDKSLCPYLRRNEESNLSSVDCYTLLAPS